MILILLTGFSISTLPFTNSKCAAGAFRFNYFQNLRNQHAKTSSCIQFSVRVKDRFFGLHYEDDVTTNCVNNFLRAREARDKSLECADSSALWSATCKSGNKLPHSKFPLSEISENLRSDPLA